MTKIIPDVISCGRAAAHWAAVWCCDGLFCRIRSAMILPFLRCFFQPRFCRGLIFFSPNAVKKMSHNSESIGISVFLLDSLSWHIGFVRLCSQSPTRKCPCFWGWCGAQKMIGARPGWGGVAEKEAGPAKNGYAIFLTFILGSCRFQSL